MNSVNSPKQEVHPLAAGGIQLALRPAEAARALGISERLLWERTHCGEIPCVRIGRAVIYPVHVLRDWLAEQAGSGKEGRR